MPDLSRDQTRKIIQRARAKNNISVRQAKRVLERGGLLYGKADSKEERKYGNVIERREQGDFFNQLADDMKLSKSERRNLLWSIRDENIGKTLRDATEVKREVKGGMEGEGDASPRDSEGGSSLPAQESDRSGGFFRNFFNN